LILYSNMFLFRVLYLGTSAINVVSGEE
jgi:hypothetical protein